MHPKTCVKVENESTMIIPKIRTTKFDAGDWSEARKTITATEKTHKSSFFKVNLNHEEGRNVLFHPLRSPLGI